MSSALRPRSRGSPGMLSGPWTSRHETDPEHLWHYSEDPAIERFVPHVPGHQPRPATDGVDGRRRARAAVLVPSRLPAHHVLGRRRLPADRLGATSRHPGARDRGGLARPRAAPASCGCTASRSTGSSPGPDADGYWVADEEQRRRSTSRRSATCSSATASADRAAGARRPPRAPRPGDRVGLPVLDVPDGEHRGRQSCSGRSVGNRMTSRIDVVSVSSITRRSMPMPSPAVGGRPYSRARR